MEKICFKLSIIFPLYRTVKKIVMMERKTTIVPNIYNIEFIYFVTQIIK